MDVWRICRAKYQRAAFTGQGAEKSGGRWNVKGYSMVYASENLSLAALELFVHLSPETYLRDLISIRGKLPSSVSKMEIRETSLPQNWRNYPAPSQLKAMGTNWLQERQSLVLIVPSAINPIEKNILLNPVHPEIKKLKVESGKPFAFDPRMFRR